MNGCDPVSSAVFSGVQRLARHSPQHPQEQPGKVWLVMHAQVSEFKTTFPVVNCIFQKHCKTGGSVFYMSGETLVCKQYAYMVTASFFDKEDEMCSVTLRNLLFTSMLLTFWPRGTFLKGNAKNVPESNRCLSFGGPALRSQRGVSRSGAPWVPSPCSRRTLATPALPPQSAQP